MNEPTKEQIQWFWEQCRFKSRLVWSDPADIVPRHQFKVWDYPDGSGVTQNLSVNPSIDLNNLFKYAVLKLVKDDCHFSINYTGFHPRKWLVSITKFGKHLPGTPGGTEVLCFSHTENKDPALALFWAIYKALKNGKA